MELLTEIRIVVGDIAVKAELFDTLCAGAVAEALPIETRPNEWGG